MKSQSGHPISINQTQPEGDGTSQMEEIKLLDLNDPEFHLKIVETYKQIGFVLIENHGISNEDIDEAFKRARELFMIDPQIKKGIGFNKDLNRGYSGPGEEVLDKNPKN